MLALTLMVIIQFCMAVSISYLHDRIKKIEQVQNNQANDLARMGVETSHTEVMVRQIYEKMFRPRQPKEEKPKPKVDPELAAILPTAEDFYQGIKAGIYSPFDVVKLSSSQPPKEWVALDKVVPKHTMTVEELTQEAMKALWEGNLCVRNNEVFCRKGFTETPSAYFKHKSKKVDGRGKGPRDGNGRFKPKARQEVRFSKVNVNSGDSIGMKFEYKFS